MSANKFNTANQSSQFSKKKSNIKNPFQKALHRLFLDPNNQLNLNNLSADEARYINILQKELESIGFAYRTLIRDLNMNDICRMIPNIMALLRLAYETSEYNEKDIPFQTVVFRPTSKHGKLKSLDQAISPWITEYCISDHYSSGKMRKLISTAKETPVRVTKTGPSDLHRLKQIRSKAANHYGTTKNVKNALKKIVLSPLKKLDLRKISGEELYYATTLKKEASIAAPYYDTPCSRELLDQICPQIPSFLHLLRFCIETSQDIQYKDESDFMNHAVYSGADQKDTVLQDVLCTPVLQYFDSENYNGILLPVSILENSSDLYVVSQKKNSEYNLSWLKEMNSSVIKESLKETPARTPRIYNLQKKDSSVQSLLDQFRDVLEQIYDTPNTAVNIDSLYEYPYIVADTLQSEMDCLRPELTRFSGDIPFKTLSEKIPFTLDLLRFAMEKNCGQPFKLYNHFMNAAFIKKRGSFLHTIKEAICDDTLLYLRNSELFDAEELLCYMWEKHPDPEYGPDISHMVRPNQGKSVYEIMYQMWSSLPGLETPLTKGLPALRTAVTALFLNQYEEPLAGSLDNAEKTYINHLIEEQDIISPHYEDIVTDADSKTLLTAVPYTAKLLRFCIESLCGTHYESEEEFIADAFHPLTNNGKGRTIHAVIAVPIIDYLKSEKYDNSGLHNLIAESGPAAVTE